MGHVYKITNNVNGKVYIGQTIKELAKRFKEHTYKSSNCVLLKKAIEKYGIHSFSIESIFESDDIDVLNEKELEFINHYKATETGYNIRIGGDNGRWPEHIKEKIRASNLGKSVSEEARIKMSEKAIGRKLTESTRLNLSKSLKLFYENKGDFELEACFKPVVQYGLDGVKIREFKSVKHAGEALCTEGISLCLKGKKRSAAGFQWRYASDNIDRLDPYKLDGTDKVQQMSLDGTVLCVFDNISEAVRQTGIKYNMIRRVCKGERKSTNGYVFKYV